MNKTIEVSPELYQALQELKNIFKELTGEEVKSDEEVIGILVSGFVESFNTPEGDHECCGKCKDKE